jgi:hypothetical protein
MTSLIIITELVVAAFWWFKRIRSRATSSLRLSQTSLVMRPLMRKLNLYLSSASSFDKAIARYLIQGVRTFVYTAECEQLFVAGLCQLRSRYKLKGGVR